LNRKKRFSLATISSSVIETVKKADGTALPVTNKSVTLPTIPDAGHAYRPAWNSGASSGRRSKT